MRHTVKVVVAVLVITAMLLSTFGCATEPAAPTPAPAAAPTTAPAPEAEPTTAAQPAGDVPASDVIELKYHNHDNPQASTSIFGHDKFAQLIEEKTNGRVKITVYPSETLGKSKDSIDMAINGISDISWGMVGQFPGRFPVTDILSLPMLGLKTAPQGSKVQWEMYETTPEMQKEWEDLHVLIIHASAPHVLAFGSKKVETLEDMQGLRIRSLTGAPLKYLQSLGATPVTVPPTEVYEAIDKGTIDGSTFDWNGVGTYGLTGICDYVLEEAFYPSAFFLVMNKKKWESLPPDIQEVFNEVAGEAGAVMYGEAWTRGGEDGIKKAKEDGVEILHLSDAERERFVKAAEPVWDEYVQIVDDKGMDGRAILEKVKALYEKYQP